MNRDDIKRLPSVPAFLLLYRRRGGEYWIIEDMHGRHTPERTPYTADWPLDVVLAWAKARNPFRLVCADPIAR